MIHVLEAQGNPHPAVAHGGRIPGGGDEPGGGGAEALRLGHPAAVGGSDDLSGPGLGPGDDAAQALQFRHQSAVPQPVDRDGLHRFGDGRMLSLDGHT